MGQVGFKSAREKKLIVIKPIGYSMSKMFLVLNPLQSVFQGILIKKKRKKKFGYHYSL